MTETQANHAAVLAAMLDHVEVVVPVGVEGLRMAVADVVALDGALERDLPVDVDFALVGIDQVVVRRDDVQ